MQPRIFVGSSSESLILARRIQQQLHHCALVQLWSQNVFRPGDFTLPRLLEIVTTYDFAVFLIAPDDVAEIRGKNVLIARDNVLFEAGLFFSQLGCQRTILVMPANSNDSSLDFHLPSDLAGISLVKYFPPASKDDLPAALGAACTAIEDTITKHGRRTETLLASLSGGAVYVLRHLGTRTYNLKEVTDVLVHFNNAIKQEGDGWNKAAKYVLQLLNMLGLVQLSGGDESYATESGINLLTSEQTMRRFGGEMSKPLYTGSTHEQSTIASSSFVESGTTFSIKPETMLRQITDYLNHRGFQMVSFERIRTNINPNYKDAALQALIDRYPHLIRRSAMKGSKPGIALIAGTNVE